MQLLLAAYTADFAGKLRRAACCGHNGNLSASWLFVFRFSPQTAEEVKAVANWPIGSLQLANWQRLRTFSPFLGRAFSYESETETPHQLLAPHFTLFFLFIFFFV